MEDSIDLKLNMTTMHQFDLPTAKETREKALEANTSRINKKIAAIGAAIYEEREMGRFVLRICGTTYEPEVIQYLSAKGYIVETCQGRANEPYDTIIKW